MMNKIIYIYKSLQTYLSSIVDILNLELDHRTQLRSKYDWNLNARENQKMPEQDDWFIWMILAGRGYGKTRTGAESIKQLIKSGDYKRIGFIGETYEQIRQIMIEGESGILNIYPENEKPIYYPSKNQIQWTNGAVAQFFSAENYESLRGPQFDLIWIDELAKFNNDQEVWDQIMFSLRLGNPKLIITTTPRSTPLIKTLIQRDDIIITRGSTLENSKNLSSTFLKNIINDYKNTKLGKQEINGEIIDLEENKLWYSENFQYQSINDDLIKKMSIIIAIDPAMTANGKSDETGIIVVGRLDNKYYVLEDASGIFNCSLWMHKIDELTKKYNPKYVIIETNQGGDLLLNMLKQNNPSLNYRSVRARENKYTRAIPIAALYEQKKVIHIKQFKELEEQLLNAHIKFKDDRMDALTWGLFSLTIQNENYQKFFCCS